MFGALAFSNQDHFRPEGFWRAFKDYDGEPINVREHQDAYEFFTRLQARLGLPVNTDLLRRLQPNCFTNVSPYAAARLALAPSAPLSIPRATC